MPSGSSIAGLAGVLAALVLLARARVIRSSMTGSPATAKSCTILSLSEVEKNSSTLRMGRSTSKKIEDKSGREVVIQPLSHVQSIIPEISKHLFPEFEDFNRKIGITNTTEYSERLRTRCQTNDLPQTLVLTNMEGNLLACGALDCEDLEYGKYSDCTPWVADLYTLEKERGKGLAALILDAIVGLAHERRFKNVYLWTEHPEIYKFYEGKGFKMLEEREYLGKTIGVFCRTL